MLPLGILNAGKKGPILVEVKSGQTFNGTLSKCDVWMNLHLIDVIETSSGGDKFWKLSEAFIRGNTIKYIRLPETIIDHAKEINKRTQQQQQQQRRRGGASHRGGGSDRGRGRSSRGRGASNTGHSSNFSENSKSNKH